jgi:hypothetical protein
MLNNSIKQFLKDKVIDKNIFLQYILKATKEIKRLKHNDFCYKQLKEMERVTYFSRDEIVNSIYKFILQTSKVLDIGPGIYPMRFFKPKCHLCIEPFQQYIDILQEKMGEEIVILKAYAQEALDIIPDKSIDSIFLLDVIEHMEKEDGLRLIKSMERIAKIQIAIFTPLGFMPQEYEAGEKDAWGCDGIDVQTHKSGWLPEDFNEQWKFLISEDFHITDSKGIPLEKPFGALWALRTF